MPTLPVGPRETKTQSRNVRGCPKDYSTDTAGSTCIVSPLGKSVNMPNENDKKDEGKGRDAASVGQLKILPDQGKGVDKVGVEILQD